MASSWSRDKHQSIDGAVELCEGNWDYGSSSASSGSSRQQQQQQHVIAVMYDSKESLGKGGREGARVAG